MIHAFCIYACSNYLGYRDLDAYNYLGYRDLDACSNYLGYRDLDMRMLQLLVSYLGMFVNLNYLSL